MKILVTGSAGFIGSHLLKELHLRGNQVLGIDNFSDYYSPEMKKFRTESLHNPLRLTTLNLDLTNKTSVYSVVSDFQPESIIHLAAQPGIRLPIADFSRYSQSNLLGFSNVAEIVCELGVPNFLYASSSSVYGNEAQIPYSEKEKNLNPISYYGSTKLSNEILAKTLSRLETSRFRGFRFFTVYGPLGRPDMAMLRILKSALSGSTFELFGDGKLKRDFTFIDDVVESIILLAEQIKTTPIGFNDVVNVGGGSPYSMIDLISIIEKATGTKLKLNKTKKIKADVDATWADPSYLEALINSKPKVSLSAGIIETIKWMDDPIIRNRLQEWVK
jgi:UDP-glucuronate 4-epimerase